MYCINAVALALWSSLSSFSRQEYRETELLTQEEDKPEESAEIEKEVENVEDNKPLVETEEEPQQKEEEVAEPPPLIETHDPSDLLVRIFR